MQEKVKIIKGLKSVLEKEISSGYSNKAIKYGLEKTVSVAINQFPIWNGFWTQKVLDLVKYYDIKPLDERKIVVDKVYEIIDKAIVFYSSEDFWNRSIQYIKGIGPKKAKLFEKLEIKTLHDLITYYPRDYDDRSKLKKISELKQNEKVTVKVKIIEYEEGKTLYKKIPIVKARVVDNSGVAFAVWYNQKYIKQVLPPGTQVLLSGIPERVLGHWEFENPEYEILEEEEEKELIHVGRIVPIYSSTAGLSQKVIRKIIYDALTEYTMFIEDPIPQSLKQKYNLLDKPVSVWEKHFPTSFLTLGSATKRLLFEELFFMQLLLIRKKQEIEQLKAPIFKTENTLVEKFISKLPFELTNAQKRVWEEIKNDLSSGRPMHRLLQGDVGSGKTIIAVLSIICAYENGYQSAFMVPTEILAEQHYNRLREYLEPLEIRVGLLTSSVSKKEKNRIYTDLAEGRLFVVVGTHALIEEDVKFSKLGLVIIDEQHRFGVTQRSILWKKGENPHLLVMTATPIPRTLAIVLYGELDVSVIDELPPGRKPVITYLVSKRDRKKIYDFVAKEIMQGKQAFVVCPLIEESEKLEVESAKKLFEELQKYYSHIPMGLIHGLVPRDERNMIMEKFRKGEIKMLVATTVIEVGVDVPNASIMVIEDAHRFGLAQLHQLRGRVGRGSVQSYCFLIANTNTEEAKRRLKVMVETNDGFKIASEDLNIRGPGEFFGVRQHGAPSMKILNVNISDLSQNMRLLEMAREEAISVIKNEIEVKDNEKLILEKHLSVNIPYKEKGIVL